MGVTVDDVGSYSRFDVARSLCFAIAAVVLSLFLGRTLHRLFLHELKDYPGPKLWAASRLPWHYWNLQGKLAWKILELHERYGPTVRIAPDELSYTTSQAWKKIYGQPKPQFHKCLDGRGIAPVSPNKGLRGLIAAEDDKHARLRRAIAPAFSERALREQETYLQRHSSNLVKQLKRRCSEGPVDVVTWFHLTTLDIISDLAFGQAEGCLDNADKPWLSVLGARAKSIRWYQFTIFYGIDGIVQNFAPKSLTIARQEHMARTAAKVQRRLNQQDHVSRDFMSYILDNKTEKLSDDELVIMASAFIVAGSGTSARALGATLYYLLKHPEKYAKANAEIRTAFGLEEEVTMRSISSLKYLTACLDEAMRLHPPQPGSLPRFVPDHGEEIEGRWVPGGTAVGVHQLASGLGEWNFAEAKEFIPERWLDTSESTFAKDDRSARQPFSYGPRGCIGTSLAYAEMRMILAKVLLSYDFELVDSSKNWTREQKSYLTWELLPLLVRLRSRGG